MEDKKEKVIFEAFEIGLLVKFIDSIAEVAVGLVFFFVNPARLGQFFSSVIDDWFAEDLHGFGVRYLHRVLESLTPHSQAFAALWLLSHGVVKLLLLEGLYRKRLWAYPVAIAAFTLFIFYQLYHLSVSFSWGLTAITVIDVIFVGLTLHEYQVVSREKK